MTIDTDHIISEITKVHVRTGGFDDMVQLWYRGVSRGCLPVGEVRVDFLNIHGEHYILPTGSTFETELPFLAVYYPASEILLLTNNSYPV